MITIYTYNGQVLTEASTGEWLIEKAAQPVIPANTIRVRTSDGQPPIKDEYTMYETATLVPGTSDIYDVYLSGTSFYCVLYNSTNVVEIIAANTTNISNMSYALYHTALTSVPVFDTSSVTDMSYMLCECASLSSVQLFDTSSVTNMSNMFQNCTSLTTVPLFNTSSVTNMYGMFQNCTSLTTIPLFNTSSVTSMYSMFSNCTSLTTVPLFNTSSVTSMVSMFGNCTALTAVPLFNTSNVTNMSNMFGSCTSLTTVPLLNTGKVTNMSSMFIRCYNVESGALALYQQASTQANPPRSHTYTFSYCGRDTTTGAAELAQIPSNWGGTGA